MLFPLARSIPICLILTSLMSSALGMEPSSRFSNGWIVQREGEAAVYRRDGRTVTAQVGMPIFPGDRLIATAGDLWIQCMDLSWQQIKTGQVTPNYCASKSSPQTSPCTPGTFGCSHRGEDYQVQLPADIPYLISPRHTYLLSPTPHLRWHPVSSTSTYTVILQGDGAEIWRTTVNQPETLYPGLPPLQPGITYHLRVDTDRGISSMHAPRTQNGIQFQILPAVQQAAVTEKTREIQQKIPDPIGQSLALAHLYFRYDLMAEAIAQLELVLRSEPDGASLYRQLADWYFFEFDLSSEAQAYYERAWQKLDPNDLEEKTAIAYGLSQIYWAIDKHHPQTHQWLTQAQQGYQQFPDPQRLATINQQLQTLSP